MNWNQGYQQGVPPYPNPSYGPPPTSAPMDPYMQTYQQPGMQSPPYYQQPPMQQQPQEYGMYNPPQQPYIAPQPSYHPPPQPIQPHYPMQQQQTYDYPYCPPVQFQPLPNNARKKALLIGINYLNDPKNRLRGAINDALNMRRLLVERYGFRDEPTGIALLSDDQADPWKQPTRANILTAMQWLVDGAQPGDSLFFHYSGHGSQVRDTSGDEADGLDETICPVDYKQAGQIIDDDIHDILVKSLPPGVRLTALMDCCHSGTGMDLPYMFTATGSMTTSATMHYGGISFFRRHKHSKPEVHPNESRADVVLFSGCRDDQTSADTSVGLIASGAMTNAFITAIRQNPNQTYIQLLYSMRNYMLSGNRVLSQVPQLSSGKPMDMNQPVIF